MGENPPSTQNNNSMNKEDTTTTTINFSLLSQVTLTTVLVMLVSVIWILYYYFPQVRVSGFRQLIRHYILRTPESERSDIQVWLQDEQFMSTFGRLYRETQTHKQQGEEVVVQSSNNTTTHFCFLVHGVNGYSQDLSYPETVLKLLIDWKKIQLLKQGAPPQEMIVHCATCNERNTKDGIANGGTRLFEEIMTVVQTEMTKRTTTTSKQSLITISMFGNSLGGLYSRYAIGELYSLLQSSEQESSSNKYSNFLQHYRLEFNVFLTTATPHLGVSKNTFWPFPRPVEIGLAHSMGETGKDLFQLNDLLKHMATEPKYYNSLKAFRKRIAYANAYRTDFPVPTATAAFLHERSSYPHYYENTTTTTNDDCSKIWKKSTNDLVIATLRTQSSSSSSCFKNDTYNTEEENKTNSENNDEKVENNDDLLIMSNSLDSLGWKKIFVDLRAEIPIGVKLPLVDGIRKRFHKSETNNNNNETPTQSSPSKLVFQKEKTTTTSREVALVTKDNDSNRIIYPLGHNMIVAASRCGKSASFNSGGRPLIHDLAHDLVELIFNHDYTNDDRKNQ